MLAGQLMRAAWKPHRGEELDMLLHDHPARFLVRLERPDAAFGCTAQSQAIASRHHVDADAATWGWGASTARRLIVDFRLRHEVRELTFQRHELLIVEQRTRAETGAIDHDRFCKGHQIARRIELAHDDAASKREKVANERVEVD